MNPSLLRSTFLIPLRYHRLTAAYLPYRPAHRTHHTTHPLHSQSPPNTSSPAPPTSPEPTTYTYRTIKALTTRPPDAPPTILIDVREPEEYAAGHIPTAKNLPIMTRPDGIFLPRDEFRDVFGWEKPQRGEVAVFYCKAGIRSRGAAGLAREAGWDEVREYPGSWLDWVEREKEKETEKEKEKDKEE